MTDVALDLQTAVFKTLTLDAGLTAELGSEKIFDHLPERVAFPYVVIGKTTTSDWSTSTEEGEAVIFFIHVWSSDKSRADALSIQAHIKRALTETDLILMDHHLIHLRFQLAETRRNRSQKNVHGVMRFRAVTEPK